MPLVDQLNMVSKTPRHVAVIMDGNGRWARQRGWPRSRGHLEGAKAVRECVEACLELGIEYLTLYTFSTENWRRPKEEIDTLMGLLQKFLRDYTDDLRKRSVKLEAIGRLHEIPSAVQRQLRESIAATAQGNRLTTILALNYSGRAEIVDAVQRTKKCHAAKNRANASRGQKNFSHFAGCASEFILCAPNRSARRCRRATPDNGAN